MTDEEKGRRALVAAIAFQNAINVEEVHKLMDEASMGPVETLGHLILWFLFFCEEYGITDEGFPWPSILVEISEEIERAAKAEAKAH